MTDLVDREMQALQSVLAALAIECKKAPKVNLARVEELAGNLSPEIIGLMHYIVQSHPGYRSVASLSSDQVEHATLVAIWRGGLPE